MTEFSFDLNCGLVRPLKNRKKKRVGFISFPLRLRTESQLTCNVFIFPTVLCLTISWLDRYRTLINVTDLVFNVTILDLSSVSKFSTFIDDSKLLYRFLYVNQYSNSNVKERLHFLH